MGEGAAAARAVGAPLRGAGARSDALAARRSRPRRSSIPDEPVRLRRRRGVPARARRVRDAARLRRPAVPARRPPRAARRPRRAARLSAVDGGGVDELVAQALAAAGEPDGVAAPLPDARARGSRPAGRVVLVSALPADLDEQRARGIELARCSASAREAPWLLGGVKSTSYAREHGRRGRGAGARRRRRASSSATDGVVLEAHGHERLVAARRRRSTRRRSSSASSPASRARCCSSSRRRPATRSSRACTRSTTCSRADEAFTARLCAR